jgi:hypothetical protein
MTVSIDVYPKITPLPGNKGFNILWSDNTAAGDGSAGYISWTLRGLARILDTHIYLEEMIIGSNSANTDTFELTQNIGVWDTEGRIPGTGTGHVNLLVGITDKTSPLVALSYGYWNIYQWVRPLYCGHLFTDRSVAGIVPFNVNLNPNTNTKAYWLYLRGKALVL